MESKLKLENIHLKIKNTSVTVSKDSKSTEFVLNYYGDNINISISISINEILDNARKEVEKTKKVLQKLM